MAEIGTALATALASGLASGVASGGAEFGFKKGEEFVRGIKNSTEDPQDCCKRLQYEAEKLYRFRKDKMDEASRRKEKDFKKACEHWFDQVKNTETEVAELQAEYVEEIKRGINSSDLLKRMEKKSEELEKLYSDGQVLMEMFEKLPKPVIIMHAPKIEDKVVKETLEHLRNGEIKRVGLWGFAGVGKTTVMKNLNNSKDVAKEFEFIIFVKAPEDGGIKKLQDKIIQRLKLNVEGIDDTAEIAWRISEELKHVRYLLLLDEVRECIDLDEVGFFDNQRDSKVILAARNRAACYNMEADQYIELKSLSKAEAHTMFKQKAGKYACDPEIERIAELVADECGGLPLLIEKVAATFKPKHTADLWAEGRDRLRRWHKEGMPCMEELVKYLTFCYEELGSQDDKFCFLYSALYPEEFDLYINYLLECWAVEGFIKEVNQYMVARRRGKTVLDKLINMSLLERDEKADHVKMNKVLRRMAHKIFSESSNFKVLVRTSKEQQDPPGDEEWQEVSRICLIGYKLHALPEMPSCKNLSSLLLQKNQDLQLIPDLFFTYMEKLRVLDLHDTGIRSLPPSISSLVDLKALYLSFCNNFEELPINKNELSHLEILDIRHTKINHLPPKVIHLTKLKSLRVSLSSDFEQSKAMEFLKYISSLPLLEELRMDIVLDGLGLEGFVQAIIEGVANLPNLALLVICFPTTDWLEVYMPKSSSWEESYFTFHCSIDGCDSINYQSRRCLKFVNGSGAHLKISKVLAKIEAFELIGCRQTLELSVFDVSCLRSCLIKNCNEIQTIIDGNKLGGSVLKYLEKMYIKNVPKLASIWEGAIHVGSLAQLKSLFLCNCQHLKKIFSSGMIAKLSNLQILKVDDCFEIKEIIMESENQGLALDALPNLKELVLFNLPNLNSIWIDDSLYWSSLKKIEISKCSLLKKLPFNNGNAMNLRSVEVQKSWWDALEEFVAKQRLQSICTFK